LAWCAPGHFKAGSGQFVKIGLAALRQMLDFLPEWRNS
jgi:hypothetical protein